MKFILKYYKFLKIKNYLKKDKFLLFYNSFDLNSKIRFTFEKFLKNLNLVNYKLHNKITKKVFDQSIYKKFNKFFSGPTLFISFKTLFNCLPSTFFIQESLLVFLGIKINRSLYVFNQIKTVKFLHYKHSITFLFIFLKKNNKFLVKFL